MQKRKCKKKEFTKRSERKKEKREEELEMNEHKNTLRQNRELKIK